MRNALYFIIPYKVLFSLIKCYRIRQLNWVSATHVDCGIDETDPEVQDLVYTSITGM